MNLWHGRHSITISAETPEERRERERRMCTCRLEERNAELKFEKDMLHDRTCPCYVEPV